MPGVKFFGFDFWENEKVADKYTGQYATHVYINRAERIIAEHAANRVRDIGLTGNKKTQKRKNKYKEGDTEEKTSEEKDKL